MLDTLRGYTAVAAGLAEAAARAAWEAVAAWHEGDAEEGPEPSATSLPRQVQDTVDGVLTSSRQNSELLVGLVRTEVERAVGRLGFVREEELAAVRRHVQRLESQLARLTGRTPDPTGAGLMDDAGPGATTADEPEAPAAPAVRRSAKRPTAGAATRPAPGAAKRPTDATVKRAAKRPAKRPAAPREAAATEAASGAEARAASQTREETP